MAAVVTVHRANGGHRSEISEKLTHLVLNNLVGTTPTIPDAQALCLSCNVGWSRPRLLLQSAWVLTGFVCVCEETDRHTGDSIG